MRCQKARVRQVSATLAVMPPAGPESTVAKAFLALAANVAMPPWDCMMYFCRRRQARLRQALLQVADVSGARIRFEIGVNHRRRQAVICRGSAARVRDSETGAAGDFLRNDGCGARSSCSGLRKEKKQAKPRSTWRSSCANSRMVAFERRF